MGDPAEDPEMDAEDPELDAEGHPDDPGPDPGEDPKSAASDAERKSRLFSEYEEARALVDDLSDAISQVSARTDLPRGTSETVSALSAEISDVATKMGVVMTRRFQSESYEVLRYLLISFQTSAGVISAILDRVSGREPTPSQGKT